MIIRDGWVVYNRYEKAKHLPRGARATPRQVKDLLLQALDAGELDDKGRAAAVIDIGERFDLLLDQAHPHDANRRLIKHLAHERHALFTFLTTGVDATTGGASRGVRPGSSTGTCGAATGGLRTRAGS
ncbi:MAG: hypothetical protein ACRD1K_04580 [Acidimicrobiales bacterium]